METGRLGRVEAEFGEWSLGCSVEVFRVGGELARAPNRARQQAATARLIRKRNDVSSAADPWGNFRLVRLH